MSTTPTQREALDAVLRAGRRSLHTCFPARVLAYDVAAQTVDVEPQLMRELQDDEGALGYETLPTLYDVPVQWPRSGDQAFALPIKPGDFVEVQCAEQSTLVWRDKGEVSPPGISMPHGLNGCMARPGWYPDKLKLTNVSATDIVIGNLKTDATIRIKPDGTVVLGGEAGALALALAPLVEKAIEAAIHGHTHTVTTAGSSTTQSGTTVGGILGGSVLSTAAKKVKGA
jgi:hypothetical protein